MYYGELQEMSSNHSLGIHTEVVRGFNFKFSSQNNTYTIGRALEKYLLQVLHMEQPQLSLVLKVCLVMLITLMSDLIPIEYVVIVF